MPENRRDAHPVERIDTVERRSEMKARRIASLAALAAAAVTVAAPPAFGHVHGITPLLTLANECGVTSLANTGANRAQGAPITGLIPRDVGNAPLTVGDGGFNAPVGCAK
jgi:hypothetical protein